MTTFTIIMTVIYAIEAILIVGGLGLIAQNLEKMTKEMNDVLDKIIEDEKKMVEALEKAYAIK